jgi:hypothetical protein
MPESAGTRGLEISRGIELEIVFMKNSDRAAERGEVQQ